LVQRLPLQIEKFKKSQREMISEEGQVWGLLELVGGDDRMSQIFQNIGSSRMANTGHGLGGKIDHDDFE
jgi:hypothetical protein